MTKRGPPWAALLLALPLALLVSAALLGGLASPVAVGRRWHAGGAAAAAGRLRRAAEQLDPDLMGSVPGPWGFLPEFRTPCWRRGLEAGGAPRAGPEAEEDGGLECLPYFHVLGGFQSGAWRLYSALAEHPGVAKGHNPRPHFWAEHDKGFATYWRELRGALPALRAAPGSALLGDASESTFAFYMAAGMRGHRTWLRTVQPCHARCDRLHDPFKSRCMEVCWSNATAADAKFAESLGLPRLHLGTPLLLRAAYGGAGAAAGRGGGARGGGAGAPKLIVLLREPSARLHSAFLEYEQYKGRYGEGPGGFLAFAREQLAAFEACAAAAGGGVEPCALQFEGLSYANEGVFFHADQVLRGLYWVFLEGWRRHFGPEQLLVLLSEELFASPSAAVERAARFLGLADAGEEVRRRMLAAAGSHRASLTAAEPMLPEARELVASFYAPHNARLGQLLFGEAASPWADVNRTVAALAAAAAVAVAA